MSATKATNTDTVKQEGPYAEFDALTPEQKIRFLESNYKKIFKNLRTLDPTKSREGLRDTLILLSITAELTTRLLAQGLLADLKEETNLGFLAHVYSQITKEQKYLTDFTAFAVAEFKEKENKDTKASVDSKGDPNWQGS